jgi:hypothetical protein
MALSIKNREVEANARELAALTGKPITRAVNDAIVHGIKREKAAVKTLPEDQFMAAIREIQARVAKLPRLDNRHPDEILYDDYGLPK